MKVEIRIGRLVLHGVSAGSAARLGAALERELTRLFESNGLPPALATETRRRHVQSPGPRFRATTDARLARGLAQNLYRSLGRVDRPNPATAPAPASPAER